MRSTRPTYFCRLFRSGLQNSPQSAEEVRSTEGTAQLKQKEAHMKTIRFEQDGAIGSIVLANPTYNRIDSVYATNLFDAVHQASESSIRVLVVRAEGPNFSFGG